MSILDYLITSRTTASLLKWACTSSEPLTVRQLSRHISEDVSNVSKQLKRLQKSGLVEVKTVGQCVYVTPLNNKASRAIRELL